MRYRLLDPYKLYKNGYLESHHKLTSHELMKISSLYSQHKYSDIYLLLQESGAIKQIMYQLFQNKYTFAPCITFSVKDQRNTFCFENLKADRFHYLILVNAYTGQVTVVHPKKLQEFSLNSLCKKGFYIRILLSKPKSRAAQRE